MTTYTRRIVLNGTDTNPYAAMGLHMNPFPQIGKAEFDAAEMKLNSLEGEPLKGEDDIRFRLRGLSDELVDICVEEFKPGERVEFTIEFEGPS